MKRTEQGKVAPEILMGIDLSNSINGGSSEIINRVELAEAGYQLMVKVPGVDIDKLNVEVIEDKVVVYYLFPVYNQDQDGGKQYARVVGNFAIPADADYEQVSASYMEESKSIMILLPFNEERKRYRSKVTIDR
mgnify:CR=1 FL=1